MNIITCVKIVPEEQDISINADRTVNADNAAPKISQYDLNAIEAGAQLAAESDGTLTALSIGVKKYLENSKVKKDLLSRGPASLTAVIDEELQGSLAAGTSDILAGAAKKVGFDIILCGEGSGDLYAQQVGMLLGVKLGVPCINSVSKIEKSGDSAIKVERTLEDEIEVLEVPLPAVISVTSDINEPKIPNMKAVLAAGKKPVNVMSIADTEATASEPAVMKSVLAPEQANRLNIISESDSDDDIAAFVENLRKVLV